MNRRAKSIKFPNPSTEALNRLRQRSYPDSDVQGSIDYQIRNDSPAMKTKNNLKIKEHEKKISEKNWLLLRKVTGRNMYINIHEW